MRVMRRRSRPKGRAATHFPSFSKPDFVNPTVHMFIEDVHIAVMPIGGRTEKRTDFSVTFQGEPIECERAKDLCLSLSRHRRYSDKELMCDVVDQITQYLAWYGRAVCEIIRDTDEIGKTYLLHFTPQRLYRIPGHYVQWVPSGDYELWKKRFIVIPSKDVWEISIPLILGGASSYRKILSGLRRFEHLGPRFWRGDLEKQKLTKHYDFMEYVRNSEIYYDRITQTWGWNRRDWTQERSTEFFNFYRTITFRWAQAVLREHIIKEINDLLVRLNIGSMIVISGLPTSDEILEIRKEMLDGRISFGKAFDQVTF